MRLLADITGHGFGHVAQSALVLNALAEKTDVDLTVRSSAPEQLLRSRIQNNFLHLREHSDFGMRMRSALEVDVEQTALAYAALHAQWGALVERQAEWLLDQRIEAVFSNISYLVLAAARRAGIPSVALCSLNWANIYHKYCGHLEGSGPVLAQMFAAYNDAHCFICPEPSMPMPGIDNIISVGPLVEHAHNCRPELLKHLGCADAAQLVLVAPGGIPTHFDLASWPQKKGLIWLITWPAELSRADMVAVDQLPYAFSDILAASDVVMTKPGYGTVTEAVYHAKPVLYTLRGDWPEEPALHQWLTRYVPTCEVSQAAFLSADVVDKIEALIGEKASLSNFPAPPAPGVQQAVTCILAHLNNQQ